MTLNTMTWHDGKVEDLLSEPQLLREFAFQTETDFSVSNDLVFRCNRASEVHGILVWFDIEVGPGVVIDNAPGKPRTVWDQGALPLEQPLEVTAGEELAVSLRTVHSPTYSHHWTWTVRQAPRHAGGLPVILRQNSLRGEPLPAGLAHALTFAPR
jgi:hypothetical protein